MTREAAEREIIVTADDFGLSPGINRAIVAAYRNGVLNSAGIMVAAPFAEEAFRLAAANPGLRIGVHLNLVGDGEDRAVAPANQIPLIARPDGTIRHGFASLLRLAATRGRELERQAEIEMRAQVDLAVAHGITPCHLDSHRHVHAIPPLYRAVCRVADAYGIARVRVVNESLWSTVRGGGEWRPLYDGGVVKWAVLRALGWWNGADGDTYFYSIFHTMRLFGPNVRRIRVPGKYRAVEVGMHPGMYAVDRAAGLRIPRLAERQLEYEALLDKSLPGRVLFQ